MTIDHHNQEEKIGQGSLFQTLTLVFAGMTLLFALLSIFIGNHLSILQADHLEAVVKSNSLENESIIKKQTALEKTQADLGLAKQETEAERQKTNQLNQKLIVTQKELKKAKADLEAAKQTIAAIQTKPQEAPVTTDDSPATEVLPDAEHSTQPLLPQKEIPLSQQTPVKATPEQPSPQSVAPVSENKAADASPPAKTE
jgi:hypothetical protein